MLIIGDTQERKMTDQIKKDKDMKEDEESPKGYRRKKKKNIFIYNFNFFLSLYQYTVLRSNF